MKIPFIKLPKKTEDRNKVVGMIIGVAMALVMGLLYNDACDKLPAASWFYQLVQGMEAKSYDLRFRLRGPMSPKYINKDIVLLDYDDQTLEWAPYPPDRMYYAEIAQSLGAQGAGARAMFYDIFFFDPFGRRLETNKIGFFQNEFLKLQNDIQNDKQATSYMLTKLMEISNALQGAPNTAKVQQAKAMIEAIAADGAIKNDIELFNNYAKFFDTNKNLQTLAPDRDILLRETFHAAQNVFLGQTMDNWEKPPYGPDDILFNPEVHKAFANIMTGARSSTKTTVVEDKVMKSFMNFTYDDLKRIREDSLKASVKGRKPLPFTKKELESLVTEIKMYKDKVDASMALNGKFGFDIPKKNPPESIESLKKTYRIIQMIPPLRAYIVELAKGLGYVTPELPKDGIIRSASPVGIYRDRLYPHISLMLTMRYLGITQKDVEFYRYKIVLKNCKIPGRKKKETIVIPLYQGRYLLVNWAGPYGEQNQFDHRSMREVYESALKYNLLKKKERGEYISEIEQRVLDKIKPGDVRSLNKEFAFFKNKMILTGLTARDTHDLNPTPFQSRYPLVGSHANLINTIVNRLFIRTVPFTVFLVIILALGLLMGYVGGVAKQVTGALATLGAIAGYAVLCVLLFNFGRIWMPFVPALIALVLIYLMVVIYRFMTEGQEAKKIKGMFATYVNPSLVETLIHNPQMLQLGGERMELTAMFALASGPGLKTDSAEILVDRLNEYFTAMTEEIFKYDGTLDKYEGNIIMAVYGAPVHFDDHAAKACRSCAGMKKSLAALWDKWEKEGKENIYITVGLNTGPMIAGNMGSASRFNYTVMGDSVNISARILGASVQYGVDFMISETTYQAAKDAVTVRMVDNIVVVGKVEPVRVYQILCTKEEKLPDDIAKSVECYEKAFQLHTERKWDEAIAMFQQALTHNPKDKPSKVLMDRCEGYKKEPPKDTWRGEFALTKKGM